MKHRTALTVGMRKAHPRGTEFTEILNTPKNTVQIPFSVRPLGLRGGDSCQTKPISSRLSVVGETRARDQGSGAVGGDQRAKQSQFAAGALPAGPAGPGAPNKANWRRGRPPASVQTKPIWRAGRPALRRKTKPIRSG